MGLLQLFPMNKGRGVPLIPKDISGIKWNIFPQKCRTLSIPNQSAVYAKSWNTHPVIFRFQTTKEENIALRYQI